jgi:hypothetical protein
MSRFADKLRNALQVTPPAMGFFRKAVQGSKPRMLLVAQLASEDAENNPDILKDTDAVLLVCTKALAAKTLKVLVKASGDASLGVWFTGKTQLKTMEGVDYIVFGSEHTPLSNGDVVKNGNVLIVPMDLSDSLARTLNDLPVESVLVNTSMARSLTWMDLMCLSRLGDLIAKPLLVQVPVTVSDKEISMLWNAGVDALVVPVTSENQNIFKELRTTIDGLPLTAKRKWMKARAIVPVIKQDESATAYDDDDDSSGDE